MRVKVYHFGSNDGFHTCSESGILQPSIVYDNLAYKDPCASEMGFSPLRRTECLFPAYSGLRTHKAWQICKPRYAAVNSLCEKYPASWVALRWGLFTRKLNLGFIFLAALTWVTGLCIESPLISLACKKPFPPGAIWFCVELMIPSKGFGWCQSLLHVATPHRSVL